MVSKEQERKALEQIRKIVDGLGEDSYIGMAFDGCFEIAQDNIENDWGCSMMQRAEMAERNFEECEDKVMKLQAELNLTKQTMKQEAERANKAWAAFREANAIASDRLNQLNEYQAKVAEQEIEIIKLKAKLYDLIVK